MQAKPDTCKNRRCAGVLVATSLHVLQGLLRLRSMDKSCHDVMLRWIEAAHKEPVSPGRGLSI